MRRTTKQLLAAAGGALALWTGWGVYSTYSAERVPYETVAEYGDVEIRRYPQAVLVETAADDEETAFRRLFRYIAGANTVGEEVSMTTPVATDKSGEELSMTTPVRTEESEQVSMTAPVRTDDERGRVTMAFYLPADYTPATAPTPTNSQVRLVVEPSRTVAVRQFSWFATDSRVRRQREKLLDGLDDAGVEPLGEPHLLQYNDPYTPPFMRRNEVAVEVTWDEAD
ncbi:heme-binding protein [Haloprofundus marisrubri]|uniref:Heme-binding protein n=1 Tax=Haloprofundus marisrubri TaxID=1514971 RepID=A0A0W1R9I2_9EURY|nr:heme-binding protein [Haloprofundus marisrubri]KTG10007.1 heme-binding protein [Haloprofundus marisrubri]